MVEITKETWEQNGIELIVSGGKEWLDKNYKIVTKINLTEHS